MIVAETQALAWLRDFDFKKLFINALGWDLFADSVQVNAGSETLTLQPVAQKRGFAVFSCPPLSDGSIPDAATRRKMHTQVLKAHYEHLIIYVDAAQTKQVWQWVRHAPGRPVASREFGYTRGQSGAALMARLRKLAFTLEDEERGVVITQVTGKAKDAFDVDKVTRRFYDRFKSEHDTFLGFLKGIPDKDMARWYVSVMLNRLMFLYFIQEKGLLDDDRQYLQNRLARSQAQGDDRYYRDFLCPLFFQGLARREAERAPAERALLGKVPYLDGGLFQKHYIEDLYEEDIQVADAAFTALFQFFDDYHWHLDDRPMRNDREINPDVLGYIFEKYINQKQMGAYYTKEDITEYISKNTVIPYLFDAAKAACQIAFEGPQSVWRLLQEDPDRYIYDAVKKGVERPLPDDIAAGVADVTRRSGWNRPAPEDYALPTEIWREVVARRARYAEVRGKLARGEVQSVDDLITLNLDIRQFAQDVIQFSEGADLLRAFWRAIAGHTPQHSNEKEVAGVTVLDPTCGSGAFLFAALNILEPLYEACLDRMEGFVDEADASGTAGQGRYRDFRAVLKSVAEHPNRRYFVLKSIIVNNLYGVDIMDEAVEICKLRLFLKLVAQVTPDKAKPNYGVEPLPDIDFNIRAGNTLVGFATEDEVRRATTTAAGGQGKLLMGDDAAVVRRIEEKAGEVARASAQFRRQQTQLGGQVTHADKAALRQKLGELEDELNRYLAREYGVDAGQSAAYGAWRKSHKPFHWFIEFHDILRRGGFDVIIGNPPYVEYRQVSRTYSIRDAEMARLGNLHAMVTERSLLLLNKGGCMSMIVPVALPSTERFGGTRGKLTKDACVWVSHYDFRPSKLFEGAEQRLTIYVILRRTASCLSSTRYNRWYAEQRPILFPSLTYALCNTTRPLRPVWPKLGQSIAANVLAKVSCQEKDVASVLSATGPSLFYKNTGILYYTTFTRTAPQCFINGKPSSSSRETQLRLSNPAIHSVMHCLLNSSLFYVLYQVHSNCRDLNPSDIHTFRFPDSVLRDDALLDLSDKLHRDQQANSEMRVRNQRLTGEVRIQSFFPAKSKPILDEIDRVLAAHYGFTDEELDYIINYDIKYRMGRDGGEEEE